MLHDINRLFCKNSTVRLWPGSEDCINHLRKVKQDGMDLRQWFSHEVFVMFCFAME